MLGGKAFGYRSIFPSNYPRFLFTVFNSSNRVRFVESNEIVRKKEREREVELFFISYRIRFDLDKNRSWQESLLSGPGQPMKYMNNSVPRFHCIAYGWFKENRSVILVRNFLWSNDFYVLVYVSSEENCFIRKRVDDDRILLISSMLFHGFSLDLRLSSNGFVLLSSPHSLYSFYSTPFYISSSFFFLLPLSLPFLGSNIKRRCFHRKINRSSQPKRSLNLNYLLSIYRISCN